MSLQGRCWLTRSEGRGGIPGFTSQKEYGAVLVALCIAHSRFLFASSIPDSSLHRPFQIPQLRYMAQKSKGKGKNPQGKAKKGRKNVFNGAKLGFLDSYKDKFLSSTDHGGFYTMVAKEFIQHFGYDLAMAENPGPNDSADMHIPKEIDPLLSQDEQNKESDQQNAFYRELREVSHL